VDLDDDDDDLFQSARLEPEMSKFVGTNGFSTNRLVILFSKQVFSIVLLVFC
jgi:hypothetical protein